jgi:3-hydroxyisobutyrate dehydrogenase-like beta-hydroxyacid dehydrogenase
MEKKVGFIGLGQMGKWMALNLLKAGFDLSVFDIRSEAMDALACQGAKLSRSPAAVAQSVDWAILSLPDATIVEQVVFGEEGILQGLKGQLLLVDCGTTDYLRTLHLSESLRKHGIRFVDAPVTGMDIRAREGTLTIMCGGEEDDVKEIWPLLEHLGNKILYMGNAGKGQLAKLINQLLYNANVATLAEVLPMAVKLGLDPEQIAQVINTGSGKSLASEFFIPGILENQFARGYSLKNAYKDMMSAVSLSGQCRIPLPMVHAATTTYQMALSLGLGEEDKGAMIKVFERILNVMFRKKPDKETH